MVIGRGMEQLPRLYTPHTACAICWLFGQPSDLWKDHSMMPYWAPPAFALTKAARWVTSDKVMTFPPQDSGGTCINDVHTIVCHNSEQE